VAPLANVELENAVNFQVSYFAPKEGRCDAPIKIFFATIEVYSCMPNFPLIVDGLRL